VLNCLAQERRRRAGTADAPDLREVVDDRAGFVRVTAAMASKIKVGVLGATGMVGQRFVALLDAHPSFEVTAVAASPASAGKSYADAVAGRWTLATAVPGATAKLTVGNAADVAAIAGQVDFVFCAVDMAKDATAKLEEDYARAETPVVSNNSAHRWTPDVPMMIPEINADHMGVIEAQRRRLGVKRGFIAVKPNCSIQSYVPAIHPLLGFGPTKVAVCTYQAISGAGKTFESWPEMVDNVIPFIKGEEDKSETEPLKVWGSISGGKIQNATAPVIAAQCLRVPVSDGHMAAVSVAFERKPSKDQILSAWKEFGGKPQQLGLPSAPRPFLHYFEEDDRPQTRLDRDAGGGQAITLGRLRPDPIFDWRFIALSHNTVRGAAGGAVLTAELLAAEGYLTAK
jgi:aspartate-semialdehyde dehydrogenase